MRLLTNDNIISSLYNQESCIEEKQLEHGPQTSHL